MTQRLPIPGSDDGTWGDILNGFLEVSHNADGTLITSALSSAGAALTSNNLSDLASASTARTNLGLGSASVLSSTVGGDLSGTLPNPTVAKVNGITVTGTPSTGQVITATSASAADWATPSSAPVTSVDGLTGAVTGLLQASNNLSDVANTGTAQSNLGLPAIANVQAVTYGAVGNGIINTAGDGHITSAAHTLTSASGVFASGDVGKYIEVAGAGTSGATLVTTISGFTSGTSVTLTAAAGTTVTTANYTYGTDNTTAIQAALTAAAASPYQACYVPPGNYITGPLTIPPAVEFKGAAGLALPSSPAATVSRLILKKGSGSALISPNDSGSQPSNSVRVHDLMLDTNMVAQPAINLPDQGSAIGRYWIMERLLCVNSGFSSSTNGNHIYVGHQNEACILRDSQGYSNAAEVTTQNANGWTGIGWYGSDGKIEDCFFGCYANAGLFCSGGANIITLLVEGGGFFWNNNAIQIGGEGVVLVGVSIDHSYNDGIYAAYDFTATNCGFHSSSIQTNNTWSNVALAAGVTGTLVGCYAAVRDGDTGNSNNPAYMVNAGTGAVFNDLGNYQLPSVTFGTGWTNYQGPGTVIDNPLASTTALTSDAATHTLVTSSSIPVGTWMITANMTLQCSSTSTPYVDVGLVAGTAVGTLVGRTAFSLGFPTSAFQYQELSGTITAVMTVTTAGTMLLKYNVGTGSGVNAQAGPGTAGLGSSSGITATRIK